MSDNEPETRSEPIDGDVRDVHWVDMETVIVEVEHPDDGSIWSETYDFRTAEKTREGDDE